jgi:8-oxo-dGTP pyrophosphatase MutT (NUDIX family)
MVTMRRRHGAFVAVVDRGRILAITRGTDMANWNLPGGTLDPGESFEQAAVREVIEETGVDLSHASLLPMLSRNRSTGHVMIFAAAGPVWVPPVLRSEPFEGYVSWLPISGVLAPGCQYRDDAALVLTRMGILRHGDASMTLS